MKKYDKFGGRRAEGSERLCHHPECDLSGEFRAPRSRDSRDWLWFCLDHIRQFNAGWNYFSGMSSDDIHRVEASRHTWNRPTWQLGKAGSPGGDFDLADPLDIFPDTPGFGARFAAMGKNNGDGLRFSGRDLQALRTLGLDEDATLVDIKNHYRRLIRQLHPDSNGGDRSNESRLQAVISAYHHLKDRMSTRATAQE